MNLKTSHPICAPNSIRKRDPDLLSTFEREIALKNLNQCTSKKDKYHDRL